MKTKGDTIFVIVIFIIAVVGLIDTLTHGPGYTEGAQVSGDPVRAVQQR